VKMKKARTVKSGQIKAACEVNHKPLVVELL
jgi:hypothetical protein